ncbi:MAG: hypothetical protein ACRBK7_31700 [Acidimicrobiales bacterium]
MAACSSDGSEPEAAAVQAQTFDNAAPDTGTAQIQASEDGTEAGESVNADADGSELAAETAAEVGAILNETGEALSGTELEAYLARRYEAYWYAFDIARRAPTADAAADYPTLYNLAAGEQLDAAYRELSELFTNGQAIREPDSPAVEGLDENSSLRVRIESLEEGVAELVSCLVNDQVTYDVADGSIVSESVRTVQARATMAKADGTWKLIRSQATGLEAGVGGCWLDDASDYPY